SVLRIQGRFYACVAGVWYDSPSPTGPWQVATAAPPEIQSIPPSSPLYNTRYVYVYEVTPTVVYVGYTPGYLGCYPYDGAVVWGTGYYYRPWVGTYYYPAPCTWGFAASYNSWGGWTFGLSYASSSFFLSFSWSEGGHDHGHYHHDYHGGHGGW